MEINIYNKNNEIVTKTLVSSEDYEKVVKLTWHLQSNKINTKNGIIEKQYVQGLINKKIIKLHTFILGKPEKGHVIDHINGNGLDNQRNNLRFLTYSQNAQNKKNHKNAYIGIAYRKDINKWQACSGGKYLGCFQDKIEAAKAYDCYVLKTYGITAKTNGLIRYDEINKYTEYIRKAKTEEKHICYDKKANKYRLRITRNKKIIILKFNSDIKELIKLRDEILLNIKKEKIKEHNNTNVTYDNNNNAIIIAKNMNKIVNIIVDDNKWHILMKYSWQIGTTGYAQAYINGKIVQMHRFLLKGDLIDHINNNKLDNRLCNLRVTTRTFNSHNIKLNVRNKYKGVTKSKNGTRFYARIYKDSTKYYLGTFNTAEEAAIAYNNKAIELYGTFASLNIIKSCSN